MDGYRGSLELRIDWSEMDLLGHVNNLAIMKYIQAARVQFLDETGIMKLYADTGVGPILASVNCQFKKQLRYPGLVTVFWRVDEVRTTSFQVGSAVVDESRDVIAEAQDVLVMFDFGANAKCPIPDAIRDRITALQGAKG